MIRERHFHGEKLNIGCELLCGLLNTFVLKIPTFHWKYVHRNTDSLPHTGSEHTFFSSSLCVTVQILILLKGVVFLVYLPDSFLNINLIFYCLYRNSVNLKQNRFNATMFMVIL